MFCSLLASVSLFHYVIAPVVNMRELPNDSAEIISQAYFSEEVHVIEKKLDWIMVETAVDHYHGWIKAEGICDKKEKFLANPSRNIAKVNRCMAHLYHEPNVKHGPMLTLPFDSLLELVEPDDDDNRWIQVALPDQRTAFIQRGDVAFNNSYISLDQLPLFSLQFVGIPYTWGGRSSFGYDCSGFVQMLYRQVGVSLPRDSKDQANWEGFKAVSIDDLFPGDLIFFGLDDSKIGHVGMYLGEDLFIHATVSENAPYIHVSCLSDPEWNSSGKWPYRAPRTLQ